MCSTTSDDWKCERDAPRVGEAAVEVLQLQHAALIHAACEGDVHLTSPFGTGALLLEHRDALGQPARHALVGKLQGDDVGELVPQRHAPVELARRPGTRRIQRDHAAEAGAKRTDHAGQADVAHREIVVPREHLDENRALRRELPALAQPGQRLARQRRRVLRHDGCFVRVEAQDHVSFLQRAELVQRVEQAEEVVGDDVVRVLAEGRFQHAARRALVARPHQVRAELA
ncbi:MAG: hypothetical protein R2712_25070 [Vicinamibacterales bacterium]